MRIKEQETRLTLQEHDDDDDRKTSVFVYYSISEIFVSVLPPVSRSQWPRGLRRRSAAARLLRLWVRIPPGAWMFFLL